MLTDECCVTVNQDVDWLLTQLGNLKRSVRIKNYNHEDFIWVRIKLK